jgi:hypothetical protein
MPPSQWGQTQAKNSGLGVHPPFPHSPYSRTGNTPRLFEAMGQGFP